MIPKECKRLAEVDFPIAVVSKHSVREKSGPKGHISTLHLWWARRPLAACRAMLLGLLLPDPCNPHCPEDFKVKARGLLPEVQGNVGPRNEDLRQALLKFIGDFSNWDLSTNQTYLEVGRGLVKAAHPEETPLVVDPFAGGGSIPLEALRFGCEAFASDLNPVACLILKVLLEDIPRYGPELADELGRVGKEIKEAAEKELSELYPADPNGSKPIAYLWARTVRCESPNCGAEIPLVRSFWLCKKPNRKRGLRPIPSPLSHKEREKNERPRIEFEIFEPKSENDIPPGTVTRAKASCLCCGSVLSPERVRAQLGVQRGGGDVVFDEKNTRIGGARLLAVVTKKPDEQGRHYRLPTKHDYEAVVKAVKDLQKVTATKLPNGLSIVPDEVLPLMSGTFNVPIYGITRWGDLFTSPQKFSLITLQSIFAMKQKGKVKEYVLGPLALALSRVAMCGMTLTNWNAFAEKMQHTFGRQALPMVWDFAEVVSVRDTQEPGKMP